VARRGEETGLGANRLWRSKARAKCIGREALAEFANPYIEFAGLYLILGIGGNGSVWQILAWLQVWCSLGIPNPQGTPTYPYPRGLSSCPRESDRHPIGSPEPLTVLSSRR